MERTNMYFPQDVLCKVKEVSEVRGVSSAEYVREAVEERLCKDGYSGVVNGKTAIASMLQMAKRARPNKRGVTDAGRRHDYYLYLDFQEKVDRIHKELKKDNSKKRNK